MLTKDDIARFIQPMDPIPSSLQPHGSLTHDIQCMVFDIYGTLFISGVGDIGISKHVSKNLHEIESLLRAFGIEESAQNTLERFYRNIEDTHQEMNQKGIDYPEVRIDRVWMNVLRFSDGETARNFATRFEMCVNPVYPMPHLEELLVKCRHGSLPLGIISNAQFFTPHLFRWFLDSTPETLGFDPELTVFSYRMGRAKPSEMLFLRVAETLSKRNISLESTLYIGNDMLNDIYPAHKTGFKTALFAGDKRSLRLRKDHPLCRNLKPDIVVTDLIQLLEYIHLM